MRQVVIGLVMIFLVACGGGDVVSGGSPSTTGQVPPTGLSLRVDFSALPRSQDVLAQGTTETVAVDVLTTTSPNQPVVPQTRVSRPANGQTVTVNVLDVPAGRFLILVTALDNSGQPIGNFQTTVTVEVGQVTSILANLSDPIAGLQPLLPGQLRFVLTWGSEPRDLDSHLWLPPSMPYHVYFSRKGSLTACPNASLDIDDTSSFGPEVITITGFSPGTYRYAVNLFAGTGTLAGSGAQVQVFDVNGLVDTQIAPTTGGSDVWWYVYDVTSSGVTPVNMILPAASVAPYADTGIGCP